MAEPFSNEDVIELDVPLYQIGGYITSLFGGTEFISELQSMEIKSFEYDEDTQVFHFVLLVKSETVN